MKILYVTTIGPTMGFFKSLISELIAEGHTVDIACGETEKVPDLYRELGCNIYPLSCSRSPFSVGNFKAISEIRKIAGEGNYDIVHCHTPIAAACTRLACRKLRKAKGLRVIYTAHGFHFFKGAPLKNWLIFYPVEKFCARFTDVLITINNEDYERAKKKFRANKIEYVPGVGVDINKFANTVIDRQKKREELGLQPDAFVILSVGEINENKNHVSVILAISQLPESIRQNVTYVIAGKGQNEALLSESARVNAIDLKLLGHRSDVNELYKMADLYVHPSFREGLPVALMEAMAAGLPCIASEIRGCSDLLPAGFLFNPGSIETISGKIQDAYNKHKKGKYDMSEFDVKKINGRMKEIYSGQVSE